MKTPTTDAEWRQAATYAEVLLCIESARAYGLIEGGPGVDSDRCIDVIAAARQRGIVPTDAELEAAIHAVVRVFGVESIVVEVRRD